MKYFFILILIVSTPAAAEFVQLTNHNGYTQSSHLLKVNNRKKQRVVMYSYSWCGYCAQARNYFRANRIPYIEYDIERDRAAKRRYDAFRGRVTPVIFVGRNRMNGFSVHRFRSMYR
ncbi:MAG: glutaredoxin family protein [Thiolinea sp.]